MILYSIIFKVLDNHINFRSHTRRDLEVRQNYRWSLLVITLFPFIDKIRALLRIKFLQNDSFNTKF